MSPVSTDEIYEKYLKKAIAEINDLGHEIAAAGNGERVPVLGSGHPRADVMLLKHRPQAAARAFRCLALGTRWRTCCC